MSMNVSGFGALAAEKLASRKSKKKSAGGPHKWSTEIRDFIQAAVAAKEIALGSEVTGDAILEGLHRNGIALDVKNTNGIGDAMGYKRGGKTLGFTRKSSGVYQIPYKLPTWDGTKWVGTDYQPSIVVTPEDQALLDDLMQLGEVK